jgi:hypothetical protein
MHFSFIPLLSSAVLRPNPVSLHSPLTACECLCSCVCESECERNWGRDLMMNCRRGFWDGWLETFLGPVGLSQCDVHCACATWNKGAGHQLPQLHARPDMNQSLSSSTYLYSNVCVRSFTADWLSHLFRIREVLGFILEPVNGFRQGWQTKIFALLGCYAA